MDTQTVVADAGAAGQPETVAIETALQIEESTEQDFEESLRAVLAAAGGVLLFHMRIDNDAEHQHVAAVSVGEAEERRFFLVIKPVDGGELRVEPVESSDNPLAGITAAYAGLVDVLAIAA